MEDKISAIYDLREAAERHGKIEQELGENPTPEERDRLLDARIELEQKTQRAITSCIYCGRAHADDEPRCAPRGANVIEAEFNPHKRPRRRDRGDDPPIGR